MGFSTLFLNRTNRSGIMKAGVIGGLSQSGVYKLDCRYDKIELVGFMTIGMDNDMIKTDAVFKQLYQLSIEYNLPLLSMGMTHDYELAIKHHATHIRIGRKFYELLK